MLDLFVGLDLIADLPVVDMSQCRIQTESPEKQHSAVQFTVIPLCTNARWDVKL